MYTSKVIKTIDNGKGCWNYLTIGIFDDDKQIGEYQRNYSSFYNTFYPFQLNDKWYALYSPEYTATRVITLPDCKDWCGEENNEWGFCPVDFFVPKYTYEYTDDKPQYFSEQDYDGNEIEKIKSKKWTYHNFGFVSGCVWGDDTSWKVQFLNLSKVEEKIITRSDKFGYIELPEDTTLKENIVIDGFDDGKNTILLTIPSRKHFHLYPKDFSIKTFE